MKRTLFHPEYDLQRISEQIPIELGGTGASTINQAVQNIQGLSNDLKDIPNGIGGLTSQRVLPYDEIPPDVITCPPMIQLTGTVAQNQTVQFIITNYDSFKTYTISVESGSYIRTKDIIYYTAPNAPGSSSITINGKTIPFAIGAIASVTPSILSPTNNAINLPDTNIITSSAFSMAGTGYTDTHYSSDWQLATDSNFNNIVQQSLNSTTNLTTWQISGLNTLTTYYVRVRHKGTLYSTSAWSAYIFFTTKSSFYINSLNATVLSSTQAANRSFGSAVAINGDGTILFASAMPGTGIVRVYTRYNNAWTYLSSFVSSDNASGDGYGSKIACSYDGSTVVVSSPNKNSNQGAVYVFTRVANVWSQQVKILPADVVTGDYFGPAVALSDDGNTLAIGCIFDTATYTQAGTVYIYKRTGSTWAQQQKINAPAPVASAYFGYSVSLSANGLILAVGEFGYLSSQGRAHIFTSNGTTWTSKKVIIPTDASSGDGFGISVDLNTDGTVVAIGAAYDTNTVSSQGSVYIFTGSDVNWSQQGKCILSAPQASDQTGVSVRLTTDGKVLYTGSHMRKDASNNNVGRINVFAFNGSSWLEKTPILHTITGSLYCSRLGENLAISKDGLTLVSGNKYESKNYANQGVVYVFT